MAIKRDKYRFKDGATSLDAATFNLIFFDLDARLHALESLGVTWQDAVRELQQYGLARINGALAPLLSETQANIDDLIGKKDAFSAWWAAVQPDVQQVFAASVLIEQTLADINAKVDAFETRLEEGLAAKADKAAFETLLASFGASQEAFESSQAAFNTFKNSTNSALAAKASLSLFENLSGGGLIVQWVNGTLFQMFSVVTSAVDQRVYTPIAYPNALRQAVISRASPPLSTYVWMRDFPTDDKGSIVLKKTTTGAERFNIITAGN